MSDNPARSDNPMATPRLGTGAVAARHAFDVSALQAWPGDPLDGFQGPRQVVQFTAGPSNPTFLLTTPQSEYVLRKQPPGALLPHGRTGRIATDDMTHKETT
jgi:hypothetical protein